MPAHASPWAATLAARGYNAVLEQQLTLRPLDLIASDCCMQTLVGPAARLLDNRPNLPGCEIVSPASEKLLAPDLSVGTGRAIVHAFVSPASTRFPSSIEWNEAEMIWMEASELEEESAQPGETDKYLQGGITRAENPIFQDFLLRNAELYIVLSVLRARTLKFALLRRSGERIHLGDWWRLRQVFAPEVDFSQTGFEVTLRRRLPVLLGVRCAPVVVDGPAYRLVARASNAEVPETWFQVQLWPAAVLPRLKPWRGAGIAPKAGFLVQNRGYGEYIVLPDVGIRITPDSDPRAAEFFVRMHSMVREAPLEILAHPELRMWVLHSISPTEPKRVRMLPETAAAVNALHLGFRMEPVLRYGYATLPSIEPHAITGAGLVTVQTVCAATSHPIADAKVSVFVDWKNRTGATSTTDAQGEVHLALGNAPVQVDRIYVEPPRRGFWGAYQIAVNVTQGYQIALHPVDPATDDLLRKVYGTHASHTGDGVKVAVVDGGVGPHPDLPVAGGENVMAEASPNDIEDWGDGHGTHVAGIIAGTGSPRGVAPGVALYSFRVYGPQGEPPANYDIMYALILAGRNQCDVVNLSLGAEQSRAPRDEALRRAVTDACERGCVLVAAAGNSGKSPITRLAEYVSAEGLVVSAVGRRGTYPAGSLEESDIESALTGTDPDDFVAVFSSYGLDVSLTAPGVGVVSTVPNGGYRPLSGTSMAAPAVTGFVARIIEGNSAVLPAHRGRKRVTAILNLVIAAAKTLGFPREREGSGLPQ